VRPRHDVGAPRREPGTGRELTGKNLKQSAGTDDLSPPIKEAQENHQPIYQMTPNKLIAGNGPAEPEPFAEAQTSASDTIIMPTNPAAATAATAATAFITMPPAEALANPGIGPVTHRTIPDTINAPDLPAAARFYAESLGWAVHPLSPPSGGATGAGKAPLLKGWPDHRHEQVTPDFLDRYFPQGSSNNLGVVVRPP